MAADEKSRLHLTIDGHVQGVGFRAFVLRKASEFGVTGWVRNRRDGSVEVVAEGERTALDKFLVALRRGPSAAMVTQVNPRWQNATGEFQGFDVKYTI
ncbi:MAG TPA: acylphosphatase [Anaerolineales bacterium]|jgi:acylphosphatase|nr:acylphosphatase [Anaerolineales bacterium]